jgi:Helix-turn-helix domain
MRGRRPSGPEYVDTLGGSDTAKQRLKVILETLAGTCRVQEACARLGISEPRFHQLRTQMLEAARAGLEPQTPGRKPHLLTPAEEQVRLLQEQVKQRDFELRVSRAREEVALTLPRLVAEPEADKPSLKKKRR